MSSNGSVLIVEDDRAIREMVAEYLGAQGYEVQQAESGGDMRETIERHLPDVVLLDVRLPGEDGLTLARYLRERYDVGIIMVTGANDVVDRVVGLEVGADDYVTKPFDPRELLARVKSVMRRLGVRTETPSNARAGGERVRSAAASSTSPRIACSTRRARKCRSRAWNTICSRCSRSIPTRSSRATRSSPLRATGSGSRSTARSTFASPDYAGRSRANPDEPKAIRTVRGAGYMFVPI